MPLFKPRYADGVRTGSVAPYPTGFHPGFGDRASQYSSAYPAEDGAGVATIPLPLPAKPRSFKQEDAIDPRSRPAYELGRAPALRKTPSMSDLWRRTDHLIGEGGDATPVTASAFTSLIGGRGLERAVAGFAAHFTLVSRSSIGRPVRVGGAPWCASICGPGRAEVAIVDHHDGSYTVRYMAATSGKYRLSIRLHQDHLTGSPLTIVVRPAPSSLSLNLSNLDVRLTPPRRSSLRIRWALATPVARRGP